MPIDLSLPHIRYIYTLFCPFWKPARLPTYRIQGLEGACRCCFDFAIAATARDLFSQAEGEICAVIPGHCVP